MNNEITVFKNNHFGSIRTVMLNNEPYFVGKDVAEALGYAKARNAISKHVDDEDKKVAPIQGSPGGIQTMTIINESGLYSLIMSSKLPNAKQFKRWVTSEVLPAIRKTGSYGELDIQKIIGMTVSETVKQLLPLLQQASTSEEEEIVVRKRQRRKPAGIIEKLPRDLRNVVDDMLCSERYTYKDIANMLAEDGIQISLTSISRYARNFF